VTFEIGVDLRREVPFHVIRQQAHDVDAAPLRIRGIGAHGSSVTLRFEG
jgi:hypothetical protein